MLNQSLASGLISWIGVEFSHPQVILWDSLWSVIHPEFPARYHTSNLALYWEIFLKWPLCKALRLFLLKRWNLRLDVLKNIRQLICILLNPEMVLSALGHVYESIARIHLSTRWATRLVQVLVVSCVITLDTPSVLPLLWGLQIQARPYCFLVFTDDFAFLDFWERLLTNKSWIRTRVL